ncbi:MAG: hypothetical protein IB617_01910 [Candidatus Nealsonbacteria bacterium]|nr:MAG: hypothetical protein IB617_01910 [Candidatus Nealsonbacteria bacterium]
MKSLIATICILGMICIVTGLTVRAADTGTVSCTVTAKSIALTVSDGDVAYGTVAESGSQDTTSTGVDDTQTVTNTGNIAEQINIKTSGASGGAPWTVGITAGSDVFVHSFATTTDETWQILDTVNEYETASSSVAVSGTLDIDLKINVPTSSTDNEEKTITVTIQAVEAS